MRNYIRIETDVFMRDVWPAARPVAQLIALDTETHYNPNLKAPDAISRWIKGSRNNEPFGVSAFWLDEEKGAQGYWLTGGLSLLQPVFQSPDHIKIFHNSQYDVLMMQNIGVQTARPVRDTMAMIKLLDEELRCKTPDVDEDGNTIYKMSVALKHLGYHFLNENAHEYEDAVAAARKEIAAQRGVPLEQVSYKDVNDLYPNLMRDYAVYDTEQTYRLHQVFWPRIEQENQIQAHQDGINAMFAVVATERAGMRVNTALMAHDRAQLQPVVDKALGTMNELAQLTEPGSAQQVVEAFGRLGLEWEWFTEKGEASVDKKTLTALAHEHGGDVEKLVTAILRYRKASKLISTYIDGVQQFIQEDGKVHSSFYLWPNDFGAGGAVTGRMSSADINLQNLTKKGVAFTAEEDDEDDVSIKVRRYYIPDPGHLFVFFDGDQQEFRLLGHYSKDPAFMQIIHDGLDIHTATAAAMYQKPYAEITDEERAGGKTSNFAKVYGQGKLAYANSIRRARGLEPLDEELCRTGTKVLYKAAPAFKYPPYSCNRCRTQDCAACTARHMRLGPDEATQKGIAYFLSEEVQTWMRIAKEEDDKYFAQFPGIKSFTKEVADLAASRGYIMYWNKRRRHFANKDFAYKAANSLIQGGCAEIMKTKAHEVRRFLDEQGSRATVVAYVHDEMIIQIPIDPVELERIPQIKAILEDLPFRVPLTWGADYATASWGDKKPFVSVEALRAELGV